MRTNIDIDDETLEAAMRAGPFKTKKDAVEAGLKMLLRQAAYREILKWEGKLHWDGDDESDVASTSASTPVQKTGTSVGPSSSRKGPATTRKTEPSKQTRHGRR